MAYNTLQLPEVPVQLPAMAGVHQENTHPQPSIRTTGFSWARVHQLWIGAQMPWLASSSNLQQPVPSLPMPGLPSTNTQRLQPPAAIPAAAAPSAAPGAGNSCFVGLLPRAAGYAAGSSVNALAPPAAAGGWTVTTEASARLSFTAAGSGCFDGLPGLDSGVNTPSPPAVAAAATAPAAATGDQALLQATLKGAHSVAQVLPSAPADKRLVGCDDQMMWALAEDEDPFSQALQQLSDADIMEDLQLAATPPPPLPPSTPAGAAPDRTGLSEAPSYRYSQNYDDIDITELLDKLEADPSVRQQWPEGQRWGGM